MTNNCPREIPLLVVDKRLTIGSEEDDPGLVFRLDPSGEYSIITEW